MKRKRILRDILGTIVIGVLLFLAFLYHGHRPIAYHNDQLKAAIGKAIRIELTIEPRYSPDGSILEQKPTVVVMDRAEIDRLLTLFELPWHLRASDRFHECDGHLRARVVMPDSTEYLIRYDHGKGIYPIHSGDLSPDFAYLPDDACTDLNSYFRSLGFSLRELGISG